jgi:magnesium transporter
VRTGHASLASKHLAVVSRRLADVATIFLPLSFLAGFFGQNFNVLTGSIEKGWPVFLIPGVGLGAAFVVVIVFMLSRRGWPEGSGLRSEAGHGPQWRRDRIRA